MYIQALNDLAGAYRSTGDNDSSRAIYQEALKALEDALIRFPERPTTVDQWLEISNGLTALLESIANNNPANPLRSQEELLTFAEETVVRGRSLAEKFPTHYFVQDKFVQALDNWARIAGTAGMNDVALAASSEAVNVARERVLPSPDATETEKQDRYLNCLESLTRIAAELENLDSLAKATREARESLSRGLSRRDSNLVATIISRSAESALKHGDVEAALSQSREAIEIRKPLFEQATWHWYLRTGLGDDYRKLADCYAQLKRPEDEAVALREYMRLITQPLWGADVSKWLNDQTKGTAEIVEEMRAAIDKAQSSSMKRFTVQCDINGLKWPFHVYVTNVPRPTHPLVDQARVLSEENSAEIPKEVMDSFERLAKIAADNNVSFVDLCVYAIGDINDGKKREIATLLPSKSVNVPNAGDRRAADPTAALKAQLIELRKRLAEDNLNVELMQEVASKYSDIAIEMAGLIPSFATSERNAVIELLQEAAVLRSQVLRLEPKSTSNRMELSKVLGVLSAVYYAKGDLESAKFRLYERQHLLEQTERLAKLETRDAWLTGEPSKAEINSELGQTFLLFGEVAEAGHNLADAASWFVRAHDKGDDKAAGKLVLVLIREPALAEALPVEFQLAYDKVKTQTAGNYMASQFVEAIQKFRREDKSNTEKQDRLVGMQQRINNEIKQLTQADENGSNAKLDDWIEVSNHLEEADELAKSLGRYGDFADQIGMISAKIASMSEAAGDTESADQWTLLAAQNGHYDSMVRLLAIYKAGNRLEADEEEIKNLETQIAETQRRIETQAQLADVRAQIATEMRQARTARLANEITDYQARLAKVADMLQFADYLNARYFMPSNELEDRAAIANELAESYEKQGDTKQAALWKHLATDEGQPDSAIRLMDALRNGKLPWSNPETAFAYGEDQVSTLSLSDNWPQMIPILEQVIQIRPSAERYYLLGYAYGKVQKWRQSADAYINSVKANDFKPSTTGAVLSMFDALILLNEPQQVLSAIASLKQRNYQIENPSPENPRNTALYHAYQAMAQIMLGQDASANLKSMRELIQSTDYDITTWDMTDMKNWLKEHKTLTEKQRQAISSIVTELEKE